MKRATATLSKNIDLVREQTKAGTGEAIVELIARQLDRADEAKERIEREGQVVRDMKGGVIAHPSVAIEIAATKLAAELLSKHRRR